MTKYANADYDNVTINNYIKQTKNGGNQDEEIIATEDVVLIAEDIKEHSDTDMSITEICYKVAEAADTFFVEC